MASKQVNPTRMELTRLKKKADHGNPRPQAFERQAG